MIVAAHAKVNLSLRLRSRDGTGYHPIRSLVQSIGWHDTLTLEAADSDDFRITGDLTAEDDNLAWRAVEAVRRELGVRRPLDLHLEKRIALAAGLGGGSADAAAALVATSALLGGPPELPGRLAASLGSDVPFCLVGGTAWMEGRGEIVTAVPLRPGYALAVAVPPFELATAAVYRRWDEMGEPAAAEVPERALPPALRGRESLGNDLLPAALDLRPEMGDWIDDLEQHWGRAVLLTGSGPACFAFFADESEAGEAVAAITGARATWAGSPSDVGVRVLDGGFKT